MSSTLNFLITVFLSLGTSFNSQQGTSNTVTTNTSHGIVGIKTLYKTPPSKGSIAYDEYYYTDKFIPFLSESFWKDNKDQPKDEPIRMQSYTETTILEPNHLDIITILEGRWVSELLILKKEGKKITKVLGKQAFGSPCAFSNVRLIYITNNEYPDFVVSCIATKVENVNIYQWKPPAYLILLFNEGLFRNGPEKIAKPVYEIPPDKMKLYPNKIKSEFFGGDALGGGVEIKKIGNEIEVIEHTEVSDNYYKWNGKVFELFKVVKKPSRNDK